MSQRKDLVEFIPLRNGSRVPRMESEAGGSLPELTLELREKAAGAAGRRAKLGAADPAPLARIRSGKMPAEAEETGARASSSELR